MGAFDKAKEFLRKYQNASENSQKKQPLPSGFGDPGQDELVRNKKKERFSELLKGLNRAEILLSEEKHNRNKEIEMPDVSPRNITKSTKLSKLRDFVALDVETTGIKAGGNDIIEVSAIHFHDFEPVEIFTTLVRPRKTIPADASAINGITDGMVKDAPKFSEIAPALDQFLGKMPVVAHNAPFDIKHLFVNGLDSICSRNVYDTLQLSRKFCDDDIQDHKLATVCGEYNIYFDGAHRASADALACGLLFVDFLVETFDGCYDKSDLVKKAEEQ